VLKSIENILENGFNRTLTFSDKNPSEYVCSIVTIKLVVPIITDKL